MDFKTDIHILIFFSLYYISSVWFLFLKQHLLHTLQVIIFLWLTLESKIKLQYYLGNNSFKAPLNLILFMKFISLNIFQWLSKCLLFHKISTPTFSIHNLLAVFMLFYLSFYHYIILHKFALKDFFNNVFTRKFGPDRAPTDSFIFLLQLSSKWFEEEIRMKNWHNIY